MIGVRDCDRVPDPMAIPSGHVRLGCGAEKQTNLRQSGKWMGAFHARIIAACGHALHLFHFWVIVALRLNLGPPLPVTGAAGHRSIRKLRVNHFGASATVVGRMWKQHAAAATKGWGPCT